MRFKLTWRGPCGQSDQGIARGLACPRASGGLQWAGMADPSSAPDSNGTPRRFATTRWSVVLAAGKRDAPGAGAALATLCESYWYPVYAFIRRRGYAPQDAQDSTQEFFAT